MLVSFRATPGIPTEGRQIVKAAIQRATASNCLWSDSGLAAQDAWRENTRLGWWREEQCVRRGSRNAAGRLWCAYGSGLLGGGGGLHAIKMARTVGRGP